MVLVVLVLGVLTFGVGTLPWARATVPTVLADRAIAVSGGQAAPAVTAVGLAILATGLAVAIGGRWVTRLGAAALVALGVLLVGSVVTFLLDPRPRTLTAAADVSGVREIVGEPSLTPWPFLAVVVGVLVVLAAVLTARVPVATATRRYERAANTASTPPATQDDRARAMDDWDALGRGEDPSTPDDG